MSEIEGLNREFLEGKVLDDLRIIAKQLNLPGISKLKKDGLIERILEEVSNNGMGSAESLSEGTVITEKDIKAEEEEKGKLEVEEVVEEEEILEDDKKGPAKKEEFELYKERMQGILDILADGYGFLRTSGYLAGQNDIYVSQSQIRRFRLRQGDEVYGQVRPPKDSEKYNALLRIEKVNGEDPEFVRTRIPFEKLTPVYPMDRLWLEK